MQPYRIDLKKGLIITFILVNYILSFPAFAAFLDKRYHIQQDTGNDILCEPYIVKKDDWVYKLFRQKGQISHEDFPEFLSIFQRLNPHIQDIDKILAGQRIVIPLKKLEKESLPGQSTGVVTIPFVTISNLPENIKDYLSTYEVQKGDWISKIIEREYGALGTKSYQEGIELFKHYNPTVTDLNLIYEGQKLIVPDPMVFSKPWYKEYLLNTVNRSNDYKSEITHQLKKNQTDPYAPVVINDSPSSIFFAVASIIDAKIYSQGTYNFPMAKGKKVRLNLIESPILELPNGIKILFIKNDQVSDSEKQLIKSFWDRVFFIHYSSITTHEQILESVFNTLGMKYFKNSLSFTDQDVNVSVAGKWIIKRFNENRQNNQKLCITMIDNLKERTPVLIGKYLYDHEILVKDVLIRKDSLNNSGENELVFPVPKEIVRIHTQDIIVFIRDLLVALDYNYATDIDITFPYAGIQIKALSNVLTLDNGKKFLIDFGSFYGDAVKIIEDSGMGKVIKISQTHSFKESLMILFDAANVSFDKDPTFFAAKRSDEMNISFTIPGLLINKTEKKKFFVSSAPIHENIIQFLLQNGYCIIQFSN